MPSVSWEGPLDEIVNPYIAGAPVTEQRMFFGREDVFNWIQNSLAGQYADHILVVHGQRRVGKTSVLKQLGNRLPKRYIPVFFDLQGRTHTTLDRFLWWLAREITRVLKQERGIEIPLPDKEAFTADLEYFENRFLPDLKPILGDGTLLLTFDEFDNLEESEVKEELARPLVDYLRRLMGQGGLNFIFSIGSSGRKLENMQAAYTEFFKTALYKKISFLNEEQTRGLITRPVEGVIEYEHAAVERIYNIASGHPYFTQLTCHELFARCQRTEQRKIAKADVEAILEDVVERGTVNLKFVWDEASDIEKWSLAALAQLDKPDPRAVAEYLRKNRVRFSETDLTSGLLHLREKDVLTPENRFVIHLLKLWLQKNRPIEQAREELTEVNPIANRYIEIGLEFKDSRIYDKAIESFQEALAISKDNLQAQVNIALVYMDQKTYDKAIVEFEKALTMDDEDVSARSGLCEAHLALGDTAMTRGRAKEAVVSYQRVLAINIEHTEARGRMAELSRQRAEKALVDGKDEEALSAFSEALKYTPEDPTLIARVDKVRAEKNIKVLAALVARSEKEAGAKNWEKAIATLNDALEVSPEDESIVKKIASIQEKQQKEHLTAILAKADQAEKVGRWDTAITTLNEYLNLRPADAVVQKRLSDLIEAKHTAWLSAIVTRADQAVAYQNWDEALAVLNEVLALESDNAAIQRKVAKVHEARRVAELNAMLKRVEQAVQAGRWDEAINMLNEGVACEPENETLQAKLTEVRTAKREARHKAALRLVDGATQAGKWESAIEVLNETLAIEPDNAEFQNKLIEIKKQQRENKLNSLRTQALGFAKAEKFEEALAAWEQYLALEPADTEKAQAEFEAVKKAQGLAKSYAEAQKAYAKKHYDQAVNLLKEVIHQNENHKDASYLLAQAIELRRTTRKWWQSKWLWGAVGSVIVLAVAWFAFRPGSPLMTTIFASTAAPITTNTPGTSAPSVGPATATIATALPTATALPLPYSWARLNSGQFLPRDQVTAIVVDPTDPGVIYAGTENAGVYKSIDGGLSWQPAHSGLERANISTLIIDPREPSTLYAGVAPGGIYKTTDGAKIWLPINSGIELPGADFLSIVVMDPQNNEHLYFTQNASLYESLDGGETWQQIQIPACMLSGGISNLAVHPNDGKTIFIMEFNSGDTFSCPIGIYKSQDSGKTWDQISVSISETELGNNSLAIDPRNPENIFFSEGFGGRRLIGSLDGGNTWNNLMEGGCSALAFDTINRNRTYCGGGGGLWVSNDEGATWSSIDIPSANSFQAIAFSPLAPKVILAGGVGVYISQDEGKSWDERNSGLGGSIFQLKIDPSNTSTLYGEDAWANSYVSTDSGHTWNQSNIDTSYLNPAVLPLGQCQPLAYLGSDKQTGYAVGCMAWDSFHSNDGGKTWDKCNRKNVGNVWVTRSLTRLVIDPRDNNKLIIASLGDGILISVDGCQSWTRNNNGLVSVFVNTVAIDPNNPDTIYTGTDGGAYISFDGGKNWGQVNDGLLGATVVYSIAVDKDSNVYAATPYGIFKLEGK
jgi:tetratricopeptide (TPR) repeat protein/photosystem II stability/assembly factor-like uncharacterized protein